LAVSHPPQDEAPADRFTALYDAHFAFVWRNLRRLGVAPASLDDAAQDVFLVVHRRLADVPDGDARVPWLFGVVRRVASDHRRTVARRGAEPLDDLQLPAAGGGPVRDLERVEAARVVHGLLAELDDDKREVFVLAELEELPAPAIAEAVGAPINTVYSRLRAARAAFDKLAARWVARRGGA
jgi:RNA polymerase sigma-70 factor (ECF subfamily)